MNYYDYCTIKITVNFLVMIYGCYNRKKILSFVALLRQTYLYFIIFLTLLLGGCDVDCYDKSDTGKGGTVVLRANPADSDRALLSEYPKDAQVSQWIYTGFTVLGQVDNHGQPGSVIPLKFSIQGSWNPLGENIQNPNNDQPCNMETCNPVTPGCLTACPNMYFCNLKLEGSTLFKESKDLVIDEMVPVCSFSHGIGVYGLIAGKSHDGSTPNPNENAATSRDPHKASPDGFYTFYLPNVIKEGGAYTDTFVVTQGMKCTKQKWLYDCSQVDIKTGELYFKILDSYYGDNAGYVTINIIDGVYKKGIITTILTTVESILVKSGDFIEKHLIDNLYFKDIIKTLIVLYIVALGLLFLLGMVNIHQAELVMRTFKLSIVLLLITDGDTVVNFLNTYVIDLFKGIAELFSGLLVNALYDSTQVIDTQNIANMEKISEGAISIGANYMILYDGMLNMLISPSLNYKILSLITTPKFYFIPMLYVLLFVLIVTVIRSVMLYLFAYMQIEILFVISPIFIALWLFKQTSDYLTKKWIQFLGGSAITIIIVTAISVIMYYLIGKGFTSMFNFGICVKTYLFIFDIYTPVDNSYDPAMDIGVYGYTLLLSLIYHMLISNATSISNSLAAPGLGAAGAIGEAARKMMSTGGDFIQGVYEGKAIIPFSNTRIGISPLLSRTTSLGMRSFSIDAEGKLKRRGLAAFVHGRDVEKEGKPTAFRQAILRKAPFLRGIISEKGKSTLDSVRGIFGGAIGLGLSFTPGTKENMGLLKGIDNMMIHDEDFVGRAAHELDEARKKNRDRKKAFTQQMQKEVREYRNIKKKILEYRREGKEAEALKLGAKLSEFRGAVVNQYIVEERIKELSRGRGLVKKWFFNQWK